MLVLSRKSGESVDVRDPKTQEVICTVCVGKVRGGRVQLLISASADVPVLRSELSLKR